jgi:hypothetical protein
VWHRNLLHGECHRESDKEVCTYIGVPALCTWQMGSWAHCTWTNKQRVTAARCVACGTGVHCTVSGLHEGV